MTCSLYARGKSKKKRHTSHKKKKKKIGRSENLQDAFSQTVSRLHPEEISIDDYFRKSVEFRTWLSEEVRLTMFPFPPPRVTLLCVCVCRGRYSSVT